MLPSGSVDPAVDAVTVTAAAPLVGVTLKAALGGWFAGEKRPRQSVQERQVPHDGISARHKDTAAEYSNESHPA